MHKLMEKTCEALEDIERSGSLNIMDNADRKIVSELVDLKKNILKVQKLEDEMDGGEYSMDGEWTMEGRGRGTYGDGMSYARGGNRGGRGYSNDGGYYSRRGGRRRDSMGRYSRDGSKEAMMDYVERMMDEAPDDRTREMIEEFKEKMTR